MKNQEKNLLQTWLDKLQQESWQLELLISGFAIFGLFNLNTFLTEYINVFNANSSKDISTIVVSMMLGFFYGVIQIFIINLLFHVIIRGLWIGSIGLRYVSGEIDYSKLKYNDKIINYYKQKVGSFDKYIINLEKIASVVFSFTFLLVFVFTSIFLFIASTIFIILMFDKLGLKDYKFFIKSILIIWISLFGLVGFDFITLGLIKRIKQRHFATFYLIIYKFVGVITLSFLWRPLLLNFLDLKFTKNLIIGIVPYFLLISIISSGEVNQFEYFFLVKNNPSTVEMSNNFIVENSFDNSFYESLNKDEDFNTIKHFSLPSNKVKGNIFEVFVKYTSENDLYIKYKDSTLIKFEKVGYRNMIFGSNEYSTFTKKEKTEILKTYIKKVGKIDKIKEKIIKDSIYKSFKKQDYKIYLKNIVKIKNILKDEISFFIDDKLVDKSKISLDFYSHPNAEEKGMLCFFPLDSLSLGRHTFSYHKQYLKNKDSDQIETFKIKIPFIYIDK